MSNQGQGWKTASVRGQKGNRIPPFAPSQKEVDLYKKYCEKVAEFNELPNRALVLGATPEPRDSAIDVGLECIAVDISQEMMDKFTVLMDQAGSDLDQQQISNWLEIEFPENHFGIVMGDASFNNLSTKDENERMLKLCLNLIKPEGYMVLRQAVFPEDFEPYTSIEQLAGDYRSSNLTFEEFFMELRTYYFIDQAFDKETYQLNATKLFDLIDGLYEQGSISQEENERIQKFRNNLTNTWYPEPEFVKAAEQAGFRLVEKFVDSPYRFFPTIPMLAFQKK